MEKSWRIEPSLMSWCATKVSLSGAGPLALSDFCDTGTANPLKAANPPSLAPAKDLTAINPLSAILCSRCCFCWFCFSSQGVPLPKEILLIQIRQKRRSQVRLILLLCSKKTNWKRHEHKFGISPVPPKRGGGYWRPRQV